MKKSTRFWFISHFGLSNGKIDFENAAKFCGVSSRTVRYWWSQGCPAWIDKLAEMAERSLPNTKEWDGFHIGKDGRLYTPFKNHSFSPQELLRVFYDKQFARADRVENQTLQNQVSELRNEDEAQAIREELAMVKSALDKLAQSPIIAPKGTFCRSVQRKKANNR